MTSRKYRRQLLTQIDGFGRAQVARFPDTEVVGELFATVGRSVEELNEHATTEVATEGATRRDVPKRAVARAALRDGMKAISRTARAMAVDAPGLDDQFRMPFRLSDESLLTTARAFAREVVPLAAAFIAHGLPKAFVEELEASIEAFADVAHEHAADKNVRVAARAALEQAFDAGMDAVRRLEAIVPNYLGDDPVVAALWERARHVERSRRPRAAVEDPAASQPAAAMPPAGA